MPQGALDPEGRAPAVETSTALTRIAQVLHTAYVGVDDARLRREEEKKARELAGLHEELSRVLARCARSRELVLVDAAAGKACVSLLLASLGLDGRRARIIAIERQGRFAGAAQRVAEQLPPGVTFTFVEGDLADAQRWPQEPDVVIALHACGPAADLVLTRAVEARARHLLLVPCCTSGSVEAAREAELAAERLGVPRHAEVRRRFIQAMVDAERTQRLEAAGYRVEVVAFVPPTVTPHNLLWRAARLGEPVRMAAAAEGLVRWRDAARGPS